jgi:tRNA (guanine37-N1)-methyltransferase
MKYHATVAVRKKIEDWQKSRFPLLCRFFSMLDSSRFPACRMIRFDIITLFPRMFDSPLQESLLKKAQERGLIEIVVHDLRAWTQDRHHTADDTAYGGGAGMVMKVDPIVNAIESIRKVPETSRAVLLTPQGKPFSQDVAGEFSSYKQLVFVCGRYEGVDERVLSFVDDEVSIGDYILSGGEIAAMVVVDAVSRLVPGVVGDEASVREDTFSNGLLKYPQFTRPPSFRGLDVPDVLMSGDHEKIRRWRRQEALKKTLQRRPDLLERAGLSDKDAAFLKSI